MDSLRTPVVRLSRVTRALLEAPILIMQMAVDLLASAGDDGRPKVWLIKELDQLLDQGCKRLKKYLETHANEAKICPKLRSSIPALALNPSLKWAIEAREEVSQAHQALVLH